jgi:hypothetical protein
MGPLSITNPQYGDHNYEKLSFCQFRPQTDDFR